MANTYSAGIVTAYGAAVRGGYTGTYEEFCAQQAAFAENAEQVAEDRAAVEQIKTTFENQTVPAAVQQVNQAGAAQVQAVQTAGADEKSNIAAAGAAQETRVLQAGADQEDAVNAAGSTQVQAVQTAGAAQVTAVQGAGTTQVAAVNAAGATQVDAVEDKGAEVIASIPQDYSALSGEVDDLKSAFDALLDVEPIPVPIAFELGKAWYGNIGQTAGVQAYNNRLCNTQPMLLSAGSYKLNVNSGYRCSYRTLDANNIILTDSGWITEDRVFTTDGEVYYAFSGGKLQDASVTLEEYASNVSLSKFPEIYNELSNIQLSAHKQDVLAVVSFPGTAWAEINKTNETLTFPADTSVFMNTASNTRYNFADPTVVSLASAPHSSTSIKVIFSPSSETFSVIKYNDKIPDDCLLVAYVNKTGNWNAVMSCRYKIDGVAFGINVTDLSANVEDARNVLCAITPSQSQPFVSVETLDNGWSAIVFPSDTTIFDVRGAQYRYNLAEEKRVVCKATVSTLQKIVFDPSSGNFTALGWSQKIPDGNLLVATYRLIPPTLTISCPYTIDGKLYGVDAAKETTEISFNANVKAVNHRGFNSVAPENTLPAFKLSRKNGFKYVETDVRFTSDNIPVLLHDATINRTARNSDGTAISGDINIADITYEQALQYDFGIWKSSAYAGTKIPSLAEFMKLCRDIGLTPRVELNVLTVANAETMFAVIDNYGMARKVEYNCNNIAVAQKFLELEPSATIVYGMSSYDASVVDSVGALKTANNTVIINMYYAEVNSELIQKCKQYNIDLEVWTVNSNSEILALDPFVSGVTSDSRNASVILYNNSIAD